MGYQLVVWEGEKPKTDAAASDMCRDLMRRHFVGEGFEPTPAIREFVTALTDIWPDDPDDPGWDRGPWKYTSLIDEASGPVLFLNLRFGRGEQAAFRIAELAAERGLVTFDTFVEVTRPCPKQIIDDWNRQCWAQVTTMLEQRPARRRRDDGYRLVVWEGTRPQDDEAARRACDEIEQQYREGDRVEPTPAIQAFVEALTAVWTDDPDDPEWERTIWDLPGIIDDASRLALFLILPKDEAGVIASTVIAAMAEERGLVAFDPQLSLLRPVSQQFIDAYWRQRANALN